MQRKRVCADDEETDFSGEKRAQQIDKVLVHQGGRLAAARAPGSVATHEEPARAPESATRTRGRADRRRLQRDTAVQSSGFCGRPSLRKIIAPFPT